MEGQEVAWGGCGRQSGSTAAGAEGERVVRVVAMNKCIADDATAEGSQQRQSPFC